MTTIDELRSRAAIAHPKFQAALSSAAERWDELIFHQDPGMPRPEERTSWSPRDVAEHALSTIQIDLATATRVLQENVEVDILEHMRSLTDFDWGNRSYSWMDLMSADDASSELDRYVLAWEELLSNVDDGRLDVAVGMVDGSLTYMELRGVPVTKTIGGLLTLSTEHMIDHAGQIAEGIG